MDFALFIPIVFFICVTLAIKIIVDSRLRRRMAETHASEELIKAMLMADERSRQTKAEPAPDRYGRPSRARHEKSSPSDGRRRKGRRPDRSRCRAPGSAGTDITFGYAKAAPPRASETNGRISRVGATRDALFRCNS